MKVTYINHSGFLLEWERCYWLFDYYQGEIPQMNSEKEIFVFSSHSHGDHFNPQVFALAQAYPRVTYVFSNEIRRAVKKLERDPEGVRMTPKQMENICGRKISAEQMKDMCGRDTEGKPETTCEEAITVPIPKIVFLQNGTDTELQDGAGGCFRVHTLVSTDCGCAFVVYYEGKTIYHAGDLHWWTWPGEPEAENRAMAGRYKKEIEYMAGQQVDLAFTPLDPRQEQDYGLGMSHLLKTVRIRGVFPMHFWNDFSVQERYLEEYSLPEHTQFYQISRDGQSWELTLSPEA